VWEAAAVIKNEDFRGLVNKREREKAVFLEFGDVCFQYHQTVLVRWVNEHTVIINHHGSRSSRVFIERFLPPGLRVHSLEGRTAVNCVEAADYCTTWRFQPDKNVWEVDPDTAFARTDVIVDRKIAALARKKLAPYLDWRETVSALKGQAMSFPGRYVYKGSLDGLREVLEGPEIPPAEFWGLYNFPHLDVAAATALGAVKVVKLDPAAIPSNSKYSKYADFI
jgi:hypothetical protein